MTPALFGTGVFNCNSAQFGNLNVAKLVLGEVYGTGSKQFHSQILPVSSDDDFQEFVLQSMVDARDVTIYLLEAALDKAETSAGIEKGGVGSPRLAFYILMRFVVIIVVQRRQRYWPRWTCGLE